MIKILKRINRLISLKNPKEILKTLLFTFFLIKPKRNPLVAKIIRFLSTYKSPEKWVFIVGSYNSGTTLLIKLLESYTNEISVINEGAAKTNVLKTPEEFGWKRMWYKVLDKVKININNKNQIAKLKKDWSPFLDKTKKIYLEKSIVNVVNMEMLHKYFSNSYFVAIIRNGYAVAEGIRRKCKTSGLEWGVVAYPIEMCAKQWVISNEILINSSNKIRKFKLIFYEDLCKNPKQVIDELYKFIGITRNYEWDNEIQWKIQEKTSTIKNMNYLSFKNLSKQDVIKIEKIAKNMLQNYNYNIISDRW